MTKSSGKQPVKARGVITKGAMPQSAENLIFRKLSAVTAATDDVSALILDAALYGVRKFAGDRLYRAARQDKRFGSFDESIFEYYRKLVMCYQVIISRLDEVSGDILSEEAAEIATGILNVLISRVAVFTERFITDEVTDMNDVPNPVAAEKKEIIIRGIKHFATEYDRLAHTYKQERSQTVMLSARQLFLNGITEETINTVFTDVFEDVKRYCFIDTFGIISSSAKQIISALNDMESRTLAREFDEQLSAEHQILSAIVSVQVGTLEQYDDGGLGRVLNMLRETHDYLGREIEGILAKYKELRETNSTGSQTEIGGFEEFAESCTLDGALPYQELISRGSARDELTRELDTMLSAEIRGIFGAHMHRFGAQKETAGLKKHISAANRLTEDMLYVFEALSNEISERDYSKAAEHEIITGINETLIIKLESIRESRDEFMADCTEFLKKTAKETIGVSEEDVMEQSRLCREEIMQAAIKSNNGDRRVVSAIKAAIAKTSQSELLTGLTASAERLSEKRLADINRRIITYYKECLLYEVGTFEEILAYSASRLKESENELSVVCADLIYQRAEQLYRLLGCNGIDVINPAPHEVFNAREHEILLAETHEEFTKGEIIKTMNNGYKIGETVVLRANVIAAR